jgi:hypothetical protein
MVAVSWTTDTCGTTVALRGSPFTAVLDSPPTQHRVITYSLNDSHKADARCDDSVRPTCHISYTTGDEAGDAKISDDGGFFEEKHCDFNL